ncbi:glycine-rich protein [Bifidobacterium sp.]|uniref:glycine-rich protein n=1 Tax=Bifidobacterium sp. TaxID=41200 RepID=UPI0039EAF32D
MLRDHVSQPRLTGPRSQMLQSSGTDHGSDHGSDYGTDHGIRPGADSDFDFDSQMTMVKKGRVLNPRSFKHMVIAASLLVTLSLLAASTFAYFSAYAPIIESTDTFGQVVLDTAVSGKLNDVALPPDDSGSGSGFELTELYTGDVVQFDVTVTNDQNKSAWLALEVKLTGESINTIANGGAGTAADIQQFFSIYPTGDVSQANQMYADEMADEESMDMGQARWRGVIEDSDSPGNWSFIWTQDSLEQTVLNANQSAIEAEDETSVFSPGGAMDVPNVAFAASGSITKTFSLHYHPDGPLGKKVLDQSLKLSVDSYGVQFRNNPDSEVGLTTWDYSNQGKGQAFIAPENGVYRFEAWGASGGNATQYGATLPAGGKGGYSQGVIELNKGDVFYAYVGQYLQGFNGGGVTGGGSSGRGGGATDYRIVKSAEVDGWSGVESLNSRVVVAGGGGGAGSDGNGSRFALGGSAGGLNGFDGMSHLVNSVNYFGTGASQTAAGGTNTTCTNGCPTASGFGVGGSSSAGNTGGGGSGWYGGGGGGRHPAQAGANSGGGGSSFISGYKGSVALDDTSAGNSGNPRNHRSEPDPVGKATQVIGGVDYVFDNAEMIAGDSTSPSWQVPSWNGLTSVGNFGQGHARITALTVEKTVIAEFESNGGTTVAKQQVKLGEKFTEPTPTKTNLALAGWYTDSAFTTAFDFDAVPSKNVKLYAKWVLPYFDVNANSVVDAGDEVAIDGERWRILKVDGTQALVLKVNPLTPNQATGAGATTGAYSATFRDGTTYFSSDGTNGYEAGNSGNYLKACIDRYFSNSLAAYGDYILPVSLNNPSWSEFTSGITLSGGSVFNDYTWAGYYSDTRFATTVGDGGSVKRAFALSYGDINATMGLFGAASSTLLNFTSGTGSTAFWLRSAPRGYDIPAGSILAGKIKIDEAVPTTRAIRPALWISLS